MNYIHIYDICMFLSLHIDQAKQSTSNEWADGYPIFPDKCFDSSLNPGTVHTFRAVWKSTPTVQQGHHEIEHANYTP